MKKFFLIAMSVFLFVLLSFGKSYSQIPQIMNFQASLMDADAKPLNGNIDVTFSLYENETTAIPLWSETQTAICANGFMNTYLGQNIPLNLPFDKQYWIEVKVGNSAYPRTKLTSSPYSMHALLASKADTSDVAFTVVDGAITQTKLDPGVKALPWGPAGGGLIGQYPNPSLNADSVMGIVGNNFFRRDEALLGDLSGIMNVPIVAKIRGIVVSPTAPKLNETFIYDGTKWKPSLINPPSLFSDIPLNGEYLSYNSGTFSWDTPLAVGPAGGDLTGTYPNPTLASIMGIPLSTTPPTNGYLAYYNGGTNEIGWRSPAGTIPWLTIQDVPPFSTFAGYQAGLSNTSGTFNTAVGANALYANNSGYENVAVGGNALRNNSSGVFNTAVGVGALYSNNNAWNTAVGYNALYSNFGGNDNTAVGAIALQYNTTGSGNTAVGNQALWYNTTGQNNTATGYQALASNDDGDNNSAYGLMALVFNVSGSNSTAMGMTALFSNTADNNTAFGYRTLYTNSSGSMNVAVGDRSLELSSTSSYNTAIGSGSLAQNTIGGSNTAVGKQALWSNTIGSNNVAVGDMAFAGHATGSNNTVIGSSAGISLGGNPSGCVFIGYNSGFNEISDNKLYIANSGGQPLIGGDFLTGRVGINTNAPAGALDVVSTTGALIVPRMTTAQRDALTAVNGMIIYNTTTNQFNFRENGAWVLK